MKCCMKLSRFQLGKQVLCFFLPKTLEKTHKKNQNQSKTKFGNFKTQKDLSETFLTK